MYKKFFASVIFLASIVSFTLPVAAAEAAPRAADVVVEVQPFAEETVWKFRDYYGKVQMRLWSITRGIWLTDWIYV